jgi:nicotinamidase-related amidase
MLPVLMLIDLQVDFLSDRGRMPVGSDSAERVVFTANRLIRLHERRRWPIVLICSHYKRYTLVDNFLRKFAAMEESEGARPDPRIDFAHHPVTFPKSRSSAFANPYLVEYLKQKLVDRVVICGVHAEDSVRATAEDAHKAHLDVTLIADGVASSTAAKYIWALSLMEQRGIRILSLEEYLRLDTIPAQE